MRKPRQRFCPGSRSLRARAARRSHRHGIGEVERHVEENHLGACLRRNALSDELQRLNYRACCRGELDRRAHHWLDFDHLAGRCADPLRHDAHSIATLRYHRQGGVIDGRVGLAKGDAEIDDFRRQHGLYRTVILLDWDAVQIEGVLIRRFFKIDASYTVARPCRSFPQEACRC